MFSNNKAWTELDIHQILQENNLNAVKKLFKDHPNIIYWKNNIEETILHCAIKSGAFSLAILYCQNILDDAEHMLNSQQKLGYSPLHYLANRYPDFYDNENLRIKLCEVLLERGVKSSKNLRGETPLHLAATMNHYKLAALFLDYDFEIDALDNSNETPLLKAIESNASDVTDLLLSKKASLGLISEKIVQWIQDINSSDLYLVHDDVKTRYLSHFQKRIFELLLTGDLELNEPMLEGFQIKKEDLLKNGIEFTKKLITEKNNYDKKKKNIKNIKKLFNYLLLNKSFLLEKKLEIKILHLIIENENNYLFEEFRKFFSFNEKFHFIIQPILKMFFERKNPIFLGSLVAYIKESRYRIEDLLYKKFPDLFISIIREKNIEIIFNCLKAKMVIRASEIDKLLMIWKTENILYISEALYEYFKLYQMKINYFNLSKVMITALKNHRGHKNIKFLIFLWLVHGGNAEAIEKFSHQFDFDMKNLILESMFYSFDTIKIHQTINWIKIFNTKKTLPEKYLEVVCRYGNYEFAIEFQKRFFPYLQIIEKIKNGKVILGFSRRYDYDENKIIYLQLWWRKMSRESKIHASPALFGESYSSTKYEKLQKIHNSILENLPESLKKGFYKWFLKSTPYKSTTHCCVDIRNMSSILSEGILYSSKLLDKKEIYYVSNLNSNDENYGDANLICTAPHQIWTSKNQFYGSITINLQNLPISYRKYLFIKFRDWFFLYKDGPFIHLTNTIKIRYLKSSPKIINYEFLDEKKMESIKISIPGETEVFYGLHSVRRMMIHLFYLIESIPKEASKFKEQIYQHFEKLGDRLPNHLDKIFRLLTKNVEIDFIQSFRLSFNYLEKIHFTQTKETIHIKTCIDEINKGNVGFVIDILKRHDILRNSLFFIQEIFLNFQKTPYFFEFYQKLLNIPIESASVNEFINLKDFVMLAEIDTHANLLKHANYVYQNYLSKPYQEPELYNIDVKVKFENFVIFRPNHGLLHALRQVFYLRNVIDFFKNYAIKKKFKKYCSDITSDEIECIQIALLFSSSGRESDLGFCDNKKKYQEYRKKTSENFYNYARHIKLDDEKIKKYSELVLKMGDLEYLRGIENKNDEKEYIFYLMDLSHGLDLMRCYGSQKYQEVIQRRIESVVICNEKQHSDLLNLFKLVSKLIDATGDRKFCEFNAGKIIDVKKAYDGKLFVKASTNPEICLKLCLEALLKPSYIETIKETPAPRFMVSSSC